MSEDKSGPTIRVGDVFKIRGMSFEVRDLSKASLLLRRTDIEDEPFGVRVAADKERKVIRFGLTQPAMYFELEGAHAAELGSKLVTEAMRLRGIEPG